MYNNCEFKTFLTRMNSMMVHKSHESVRFAYMYAYAH